MSHRFISPAVFVAALAALGTASHADAANFTASPTISYSVSSTGVSKFGGTNNSRYAPVGGSSLTASSFPAYAVYDFSGSSLLSKFRTAYGDASSPIGSASSVQLTVGDVAQIFTGAKGVAGTLSLYVATDTPSAVLAVQASTPVFDTSTTNGVGTSLGTLVSVGSFAYTPATTANTPITFDFTGAASNIVDLINGGSNVRFVVAPGDATVKTVLSGWFGLPGFVSQPVLSVAAVPEPSAAGLGLVGVGTSLLARRRRAC